MSWRSEVSLMPPRPGPWPCMYRDPKPFRQRTIAGRGQRKLWARKQVEFPSHPPSTWILLPHLKYRGRGMAHVSPPPCLCSDSACCTALCPEGQAGDTWPGAALPRFRGGSCVQCCLLGPGPRRQNPSPLSLSGSRQELGRWYGIPSLSSCSMDTRNHIWKVGGGRTGTLRPQYREVTAGGGTISRRP